MTPFHDFRLWARRAPAGERASGALIGAVALGLLIWVLVPAGNKSGDAQKMASGARASSDAPSGGTAGTSGGEPSGAARSSTASAVPTAAVSAPVGGAASAGNGRVASGASASSNAARSGAPATAAASGGCVSPPGSDQGVTGGQIKIAVTIVNIVGPAGNATFGVPSPDEQRLDFQQVIDALNATGGAACRKVVPQYYDGNPADQNDLQQKCLDIVQSKPFFVLDAGAYYGQPTLTNCFPQHQLPFLSTARLVKSQRDKFYPYLFSTGSMEVLYKNAIYALKDRGFFSAGNGFKKLGHIYRSCAPEVTAAFRASLHDVGVPQAQIVEYDVGCPTGFANPSDIQQAILKFQQAGVTHMTESFFFSDFANFTKVAQAQGFRPKYGLADDGIVPTTTGNLHPDYDNIADAIAIAGDRYGEENAGLAPTAGTRKCDAIFTAKGRPPIYKQPVGFGGVACDEVWMMATAIDHAPTLVRSALADGLHIAKSIDFSYPRGPSDFTGPRVTYGGQFWRPLQFFKTCSCWKVIDPTFRPSF